MKLNNSHKALAITLLIVGTLVLSVFNFEVSKYNTKVSEIFIDITPVEVLKEIEEQLEEQQIEDETSSKTNKGYNDTKNYKHFAQAYKTIAPPKDFEDPRLTKRQTENFEINTVSKDNTVNKIQDKELTSFESVNSILNKRAHAEQQSDSKDAVNKNSSIIYSLKGRTDTYLPIPIYLCEASGKIVVNITVDQNGKVTSTSINSSSSTSSNTCLQKHALEYAKESRFNSASKASQIGTITFSFQGKR